MIDKMQTRWGQIAMIIAGCFLYAFGMNAFIVPFGLYTGGGVGISQIITYFLEKFLLSGRLNLYGIVNLFVNIPLLFLAWKSMGRTFFFKTLFGAGMISVFMSVLPVIQPPLLEDCLASSIVGGVMSGIGVGLVLTAGGCGGGVDIVAVWAAKRFKNASVGKISLAVNVVIYAFLLLMFDSQIVIYSLIQMVFFTILMDKVHYQNINVRLMIFTKQDGIDQRILEQTGRGVTEWTGVGAYTKEDTHIMISCINKYEMNEFMEIIHGIDPSAFVIVDEGVYVTGNFEKRI